MADLFERLFPTDPGVERIAGHYFRAAVGDYAAGHTSQAEIVAHWNLDAEAQVDLDVLLAQLDGLSSLDKARFLLELHDVLNIAESGAKYTTKATFKARMGL